MKKRPNIYERSSSLRPGKSVFDLSYEKKFTCDMGQLIPIVCDEMVPGDTFTVGMQSIVRFQPLVAPVLHEINIYAHYFFVPYRLLWDEWEDFITGGPQGDLAPAIPEWYPDNFDFGSLWDFLGFPVGTIPLGALPISFPRDAYNFIYNEYYRDENLQDEVDLTNESILNRCWEKDYFTSALPWQQRGLAPSLPISGITSAVWAQEVFQEAYGEPGLTPLNVSKDFVTPKPYIYTNDGSIPSGARTNIRNALNSNTIDLSTASTFDIADLRLAFQIQKWMERNARAGARYTEFLKSHFDESPRDDRLQRPEYIGGCKTPCIISEVLQTSSTDSTSPQGNLAGHGIAVTDSRCGTYHAKEYGLIMGIYSVMPRTAYMQGISRQWLRKTKFDYYFPEFANLSEQAITQAEVYATGVAQENVEIFGYAGRYDEMRTKQNMIVSEMRSTFDYWHLGRIFAGTPLLNSDFVTCNPSKRIFAVQDEPGLICNVSNIIKAVRPLPVTSEPGLIDHN